MKRSILLVVLSLYTFGCEKGNVPHEEDFRTPYAGLFKLTTVKSTMVMCYDTLFPCIDGWKPINIDTNHVINEVEKYDTNRMKIEFGNSIIGVDDKGDTISKTIYPIISSNGDLSLPEFPYGGHNSFSGFYKGHDTIEINLQFGYGIGGYDTYKIVGIRE